MASGGPAPSERTNGMPYHEYIGNNKRLSGLFDHAMAQHSAIRARKMLERFEGFDGIQRLVDVGGGDGSTLGMITSRYKHIRGINYDLPHVISQAPSLPGICDRDFVLTTSIQFARRTDRIKYLKLFCIVSTLTFFLVNFCLSLTKLVKKYKNIFNTKQTY